MSAYRILSQWFGFHECCLPLSHARVVLIAVLMTLSQVTWGAIEADDYGSIQAAIDANPGRVITLSGDEYRINEALRITTDGSGIEGYGTIVQSDPSQPILIIEGASHVRVVNLTFLRPPETEKAAASAILCTEARDVTLDSVRVLNNKSQRTAIAFRHCQGCVVRDSDVINYKCIGIDDRTDSAVQGYAFHCIDGTGIGVYSSHDMQIRSNRVIEKDWLPTKANSEKYHLGKLTDGKRPTSPGELGKRAVDRNKVKHWHQGSAIFVGDPSRTKHVRVTDNYIENCAQGVDMHCDEVICSGNTVNKAMIGLKMTHGSRNVILAGNLISGADLWGILLNPGAGSHYAEKAKDGGEPILSNVDGGTLIANNVITEFGRGNDYWNWGGEQEDRGSSYGITLQRPQLDKNPPLRDILIQGNLVYNSESEANDGKGERPKYRYAVHVEHGRIKHSNIRFSGNLFAPGTSGVSNVKVSP